ncbi:DUF72 domain-containing protein [Caldimonas brevitalea]|uniref:Glutamate synthase [NADPH] large chain n=1 Tax=Caldimonas brevitalea TaxID=413882 RepID=A0A0G3BNK9_9BURK|nr:DUF72 domain-containing protein [Caldimonas brevitalea]AKJ29578.1 glutamate synthase [NADPH] large chain [Caldimonas brevitalea]
MVSSGGAPAPSVGGRPKPPPADAAATLEAAAVSDEVLALAAALPAEVRFGTSSWHFPGWEGLVWGRGYAEGTLSKRGLTAYSQHPLLRCVSLDRSFYRPLDAAAYAQLAAQVAPGFRFVVKAPSSVTDAVVRSHADGRAMEPNPLFLDAGSAVELLVRPAVQGLGPTLGVLVFQVSPLPLAWLTQPAAWLERLDTLLAAVSAALADTGHPALVAVEVRDPELLTPALAACLKRHGASYCLGLHDRMPTIDAQLPLLRALWPGPLVCRWNLQRGFRYEQARRRFEPFDRLLAPDPDTRHILAKVIAATAGAGHAVFVTINNKAEGSAPLSVLELAKAVLGRG